jgi:anti-sigma-K factor RskA
MLYDGQKGEIKFTRVSGAPVSGRDFQLWLIQGKNAPISLGVLPAQDKGIIKLSDDLKAKLSGSILAISDEPAGGSPTGQPTGAVLATGAMTLI